MTDETIHTVRDPGFDGRVREFTRNGWQEDVEMLAIEELVTEQYSSIDGNGTTTAKEPRARAKIREENAYDVMIALADYLGYEVTGR